jgi:hypothetical protein
MQIVIIMMYNNDMRSQIKRQKLVSFLSYQVILKMWKKEE